MKIKLDAPGRAWKRSSSSRVTRYEHNFQRGVGVPEQSAVLLGLFGLRGPTSTADPAES
ncbi:MAG: DUF480 domain-containing protein [Rhodoferax sp.]|nr:DUF480 domain-containing protein [Rhodoferax sp.]